MARKLILENERERSVSSRIKTFVKVNHTLSELVAMKKGLENTTRCLPVVAYTGLYYTEKRSLDNNLS